MPITLKSFFNILYIEISVVSLQNEMSTRQNEKQNDIDDTIPAAKAIKQILGNLSAITEGIATLRNSYGSGHGRAAS